MRVLPEAEVRRPGDDIHLLRTASRWTSPDGNTEYTLTDTRNTLQSKAELLKMAGSLTAR